MSQIRSIAYQPERLTPDTHFHRVPVDSVNLIADYGIEGDRKAGKNPERHLNIMSSTTLETLAAAGFKTGPGEMGEQLVVEGLDVDSLSAGARLRLGDEAEVRISKPRTGCNRFQQIQGKSPDSIAGQMGVMATVIRSGTIRVGDPVVVLEAQPEG